MNNRPHGSTGPGKGGPIYCPQCGLRQPYAHRYCVSCGTSIPRHLLRPRSPKVSRWFLGIPIARDDPEHAALRVTRYLEEIELRSAEGTVRVPSHHVRFSIWERDTAVAALSIPDDEAAEVAQFLASTVGDGNGAAQPVSLG